MRYRKKPIEVDAFRLTHVYGATIDTREGRMKAKIGDYIIRGVNGEIYPCKPDIFKKTYEPVRGGEKNETESHKAVCG